VLLENNAQEQLIFKHAISTVVSGRVGPHADVQAAGKPELRTPSGPGGAAAAGSVLDEAAG
jgi:host factor-I protein